MRIIAGLNYLQTRSISEEF